MSTELFLAMMTREGDGGFDCVRLSPQLSHFRLSILVLHVIGRDLFKFSCGFYVYVENQRGMISDGI